MAHVVTERCVDCRYTDCCTVCPVDCFWETTNPVMLVIDPEVCIDCAQCVPACPIAAIWPEDELPAEYKEWTAKNRDLFKTGTNIKTLKGPVPGALKLSQLQAREKSRGWDITEPSNAGDHPENGHAPSAETAPAPASMPSLATVHSHPIPSGLSETESAVYNATANCIYKWRSVKGVAAALKLPQGTVQGDLDKLVSDGHLKKQAPKTKGLTVYGAVIRLAS